MYFTPGFCFAHGFGKCLKNLGEDLMIYINFDETSTYYGRNHLQVNSTNKLWLNFKLISFFCYPLMISSFKWFETQYVHSYLLLSYEISIKSIVSILILTYWYYLMINNNLFLLLTCKWFCPMCIIGSLHQAL